MGKLAPSTRGLCSHATEFCPRGGDLAALSTRLTNIQLTSLEADVLQEELTKTQQVLRNPTCTFSKTSDPTSPGKKLVAHLQSEVPKLEKFLTSVSHLPECSELRRVLNEIKLTMRLKMSLGGYTGDDLVPFAQV